MAMLNRRNFLGACCAIHAGSVFGQEPRQQFACGTVDRDADANQSMSIDNSMSANSSNRSRSESSTKEFALTPYGTANIAHRWRSSDGLTPGTSVITLGVHFMNGSADHMGIIERGANRWLTGELSRKLRFEYGVPRNQAQITILIGRVGNNSIIGRASAAYAQSQATMNLQDVFEHVVAHEFGHAIGIQHEHQNPNIAINWNKEAVIADMAAQGWTPQMCESNIFTRYSRSFACVSSPDFDPTSIMLYPIPSNWTTDGYSTKVNTTISKGDRDCAAGIYNS